MTEVEKVALFATWVCEGCKGQVDAKGDQNEVISNAGGATKDQVWLYCKKCNIETFHDLPDDY